MILLEYEAKSLLKRHGIPTPNGSLVSSAAEAKELEFPVVLKSQVPVGGRGHAGGIRIAKSAFEAEAMIKQILNLSIKNFKPKKLLAEEKLNIAKEFYLAITIDRDNSRISLLAHKNGGINIEEQTDPIQNLPVDNNFDYLANRLAEYFEIEDKTYILEDIIRNLYNAMTQEDAVLIEINPLILTEDNQLIAGDAKVSLDDAAFFKHLDWDFEFKPTNKHFTLLDKDGQIATMANGAGLAMATVDSVKAAGFEPTNFLDIGGGSSSTAMAKSFELITSSSSPAAIVVNIVGGITRCDEVAHAIVTAKSQIINLPPLFIRLSGTNFLEGQKILKENGLNIFESFDDCLLALKKEVY